MSDDTALTVLRKVIKGLNISKEYESYFDPSDHTINTIDQFKPGGVAAYQGSHYYLKDSDLPDDTLCFSCMAKKWSKDVDQQQKTDILLQEVGIKPLFFEEQEKIDALLTEYGISHSFINMHEQGDEKQYHSVLAAVDTNQSELLEKLTKLFHEKAQPALVEAHTAEIAQKRLISAMRNYAAAAGYEQSHYIEPLRVYKRGYYIGSAFDNRDPSPELKDALVGFLIETGLNPAPLPKLPGWEKDKDFYFGELTSEQLNAATARIEFETIQLTGHKTVGQYKGFLLTQAFDQECEGQGDKRTLQTLLGMIEGSQTIPANTRRRLITSIERELNGRERT